MSTFRLTSTLVAAALAVAAPHVLDARVDVRVEFDKTFDFKPVRTWAWNPTGPGEVKMARTKDDDPEAMRKYAEPVIVEAVVAAMTQRKLQQATATPDVTVTYYLLLTNSVSAQTVGQFIPGSVSWGLPIFPPATQSLEMMNQGSLVIDLSANKTVVWRGVARAQIKVDVDAKRRESKLREAVRDLLRRYPPRQ